MRKYYSFGDMVMALRNEYQEVKPLLDELNKYVHVDDKNSSFHFYGRLSDKRTPNLEDRRIFLCVQRRYNELLKKIQELRYKWYAQYRYTAYFNAAKGKDGQYGLEYCDVYTPSLSGKKYGPKVEITHPKEFGELADQIFASDLMQVKNRFFDFNNDFIELEFDNALISSCLGLKSRIEWDGKTDRISYDVEREYYPSIIDSIFDIVIPSDEITEDWLKLLQKHENDYNFQVMFDNDCNNQERKGIVTIKDITDNGTVQLSRTIK